VDCIALRPWLVYMRVQDFFLCVCWEGGGGGNPRTQRAVYDRISATTKYTVVIILKK
jgi:hypothetical protein